jgi:hypothetical protein
MGTSFYSLIAASLLGQSYPVPAPAPGVLLAPGPHAAAPALPLPWWAPLCKRLQATTTVWQAPIPMPLEIMSDYPSACERISLRLKTWHSSHHTRKGSPSAH